MPLPSHHHSRTHKARQQPESWDNINGCDIIEGNTEGIITANKPSPKIHRYSYNIVPDYHMGPRKSYMSGSNILEENSEVFMIHDKRMRTATAAAAVTTTTTASHVAGQWKDGLFSCLKYGICHPHIWNAWLCPQILMNQILQRMQIKLLTSASSASTKKSSASSFRCWRPSSFVSLPSFVDNKQSITTAVSLGRKEGQQEKPKKNKNRGNSSIRKLFWILIIATIYYDAWMTPSIFENTLMTASINDEPQQHSSGTVQSKNQYLQQNSRGLQAIDYTTTLSSSPSSSHSTTKTSSRSNSNNIFYHQLLYLLLSLPMTIYGLLVIVKLRIAVRFKYGIPTGRLGHLEDWIYAIFCNCCILSQMARQTADYDHKEPASCCTPNGIQQQQQLDDCSDDSITTTSRCAVRCGNNRNSFSSSSSSPLHHCDEETSCGELAKFAINAAVGIPMV